MHSCLNVLVGIANGVGRRRAARRDHVAIAAKSEAHADFAGQRAHGAAGDAEQADLLDVSGVPEPVLLFGKFLSATARAEDHANLALLLHRHVGVIDAGVLMASVDAAIASGTTRETCLRSCASTQASSSNSGISPAICTGRSEGIEARNAFYTCTCPPEWRGKKPLCPCHSD